MKKWVLLSVIILLLILMLFWSQRTTTYPLMQEKDAVAQIDIVNINNFKIINTGSFDQIVSVKRIDADEHLTFFSTFRDLPCYKSLGPSQECLEGKAIRFIFQDGAFELVGAETSFYCSADNERSYMAYYFDYELFNQYILMMEQ